MVKGRGSRSLPGVRRSNVLALPPAPADCTDAGPQHSLQLGDGRKIGEECNLLELKGSLERGANWLYRLTAYR